MAKAGGMAKAGEWKALDAALRVEPGAAVALTDARAEGEGLFADKAEGKEALAADAQAIAALQENLWAERRRALLVVLQGMDTSGKDGATRAVFGPCGPLGVHVTAFGRPSAQELAHDFLWRVHAAAPPLGTIGVFNRSHYEDVVAVKVRALAPADVVERRYDQINAFEKHLSENGVTILKFMLHITKEAQRERLQERLDDPGKRWKFDAGDIEDRALWDAYQDAYQLALSRCSTPHAPWRIVPSDRKWRRNAVIARCVRVTLEQMDPRPAQPDWDPKSFVIP